MLITEQNLQSKISLIQSYYPQIKANQVALNVDGQNSDIIIINGEVVFRFPRYDHVVREMETEVGLLQRLQNRLPIEIPSPEFIHLDAPPGQAFIGYKRISGEPLWRHTFQSISQQSIIDNLADQFGEFLTALHTIKEDVLSGLHLESMDSVVYYRKFFDRLQQNLFPLMREVKRQEVTRYFENYFKTESEFKFQPVLRHGDFGSSNLLFDAKQGSLSGVIDFSSTTYGDPAVDFAGLMICYGEAFLKRVQRTYPEIEDTMERICFYMGTFALEEALFGFENGDGNALKAGMADYV